MDIKDFLSKLSFLRIRLFISGFSGNTGLGYSMTRA